MKKKSNLINKKYGSKFKEHLLEQYKIYVETAERVSEKRQSANNFYLTLTSSIFALSSYLSIIMINFWIILLSAIGIVISLVWIKNIISYKQLNTGKYQVIHKLEEHLPASLFKTEWNDYLEKGEGQKYTKLTNIEKYVPEIFIILYSIIIVFSTFSLIGFY